MILPGKGQQLPQGEVMKKKSEAEVQRRDEGKVLLQDILF